MEIVDIFKYYQENDPKHIVQEYLLYNCLKLLHSPPQSPNLKLHWKPMGRTRKAN